MTKGHVRLSDLFRYFKGLPHQLAALTILEEELTKVAPSVLDRNNEWFKVWSQSGKHYDLLPAITLIKEYEGLSLESYICPAGVLTIGYGSTGPHVKQGQKISEAEATVLLAKDMERFITSVDKSIKQPLTNNQRCALISFAFNIGTAAFEDSSLVKRINNGENANKVASEELPRWTKANGTALAGLVRRRNAELALFKKP